MTEEDPNAGLFGRDEPEMSEEEFVEKQIYDKNPKRASALGDLSYDSLIETLNGMDVPEAEKMRALFNMAVGGTLDLVADALPIEDAIEVSFSFDIYLGVALTNKRFGADLFKESQKALVGIKPSESQSDEAYQKTLIEAEDAWWDMPQPRLDKRTPNEAIRETLGRYGLTE
ncbi:MAG: hypothetical protein LBS92_03150 [Candidatus Methanoplasma sp.]|jgi:hypothetical protein|nr:hypothetical protein [Candidatus Methanoplasma sp.]